VLNGSRSVGDILTRGPEGVCFISSGSGLKELMNISPAQLGRFIEKLGALDSVFDVIIVDTGAGVSNQVLAFVKAATQTIVVTTPEPTSITDAYALLKASAETGSQNSLKLNPLQIVVNRAETRAEGQEVFDKLSRAAERFLGVKVENLGFVPYDLNLIKAVKMQTPAALAFPSSGFSQALKAVSARICRNIDCGAGNTSPYPISVEIARLPNPRSEGFQEQRSGIKGFLRRLAGI
jgi:flagellar biosynthesis protein FlhG